MRLDINGEIMSLIYDERNVIHCPITVKYIHRILSTYKINKTFNYVSININLYYTIVYYIIVFD